jgi:hypothetical protein
MFASNPKDAQASLLQMRRLQLAGKRLASRRNASTVALTLTVSDTTFPLIPATLASQTGHANREIKRKWSIFSLSLSLLFSSVVFDVFCSTYDARFATCIWKNTMCTYYLRYFDRLWKRTALFWDDLYVKAWRLNNRGTFLQTSTLILNAFK